MLRRKISKFHCMPDIGHSHSRRCKHQPMMKQSIQSFSKVHSFIELDIIYLLMELNEKIQVCRKWASHGQESYWLTQNRMGIPPIKRYHFQNQSSLLCKKESNLLKVGIYFRNTVHAEVHQLFLGKDSAKVSDSYLSNCLILPSEYLNCFSSPPSFRMLMP